MWFKKIKKGLLFIGLTISILLIGQILLLAIQSETPEFKNKVNNILELIPSDSDEIILFQDLKNQSQNIIQHDIVKEFKALKLSEELVYSKESKLTMDIIKSFEKYSGMEFDENMFFRFFGEKGAIALHNKDLFVVSKVDRLTLFLKQLAKTLSEYEVLNKEIETTNYKGINIESLTFRNKKYHFTFIQDYMFLSNNDSKIKSVIDKAKGETYLSYADNKNLKMSLTNSNKSLYPIVLYKKDQSDTSSIPLGKDRLNEYFKEKIWTIDFTDKKVTAQYQYYFSKANDKYPMAKMISKETRKESKLMEGFPRATAFYIKSEKFNHNELYNWFIKSWLSVDGEAAQFNSTFEDVEKFYKVPIREMIKNELGNETALVMSGIGYQGFNPFPKMAYIVKTSKYAKPMDKMKKIFKYALGVSDFKSREVNGVPVVYYPSEKRIGYYYYYYKKKDTTSAKKEFSPSFSYVDGYLVVTFNDNTMKAIINYFKNGKGIKENSEHQEFWKANDKDYAVQYYLNPDRTKNLAKTYLEYLYKNETDVFYHQDAEKRLTPMLDLLSNVKSIGGGFNIAEQKIEGDLIINLK